MLSDSHDRFLGYRILALRISIISCWTFDTPAPLTPEIALVTLAVFSSPPPPPPVIHGSPFLAGSFWSLFYCWTVTLCVRPFCFYLHYMWTFSCPLCNFILLYPFYLCTILILLESVCNFMCVFIFIFCYLVNTCCKITYLYAISLQVVVLV